MLSLHRLLPAALSLLASAQTATAAALPSPASLAPRGAPALPLSVHNITRLPRNAFENLALRSNDQILAICSSPLAQIYQIDPLSILPPILVATLPGLQHANGIWELTPDVFYVAAGNISITNPSVTFPETLGLWRVDMRPFKLALDGTVKKPACVEKIASIPKGTLLNGVAAPPGQDKFVLVADTFAGLIWHVDIKNGQVTVAFKDATLAGKGTGSSQTGVNGLGFYNGMLWYSNTGMSNLYKVKLGSDGYVSNREAPILVASDLTPDDFAVDRSGVAWVASGNDVVFRVSADGKKETIAGVFTQLATQGDSALVGSTSVRFGRGASDRASLYVTIDGGIGQPDFAAQGVSRIDVLGFE